MERNHYLNLLKCMACVAVVLIHVRFPGEVGTVLAYLSSWAVPLFMMISGYFAFDCDENTIRRRLIRMVRILVFGWVVFMVVNILFAWKDHYLMSWLKEAFGWTFPMKILVFCSIKGALPLWYLIAMTETYLLWWFVVRKNAENKAVKWTWLLFVLSVSADLAFLLLGVNSEFSILFVLKALPWFMLGYWLKSRTGRWSLGRLWAWIAAGGLFSLLLVSVGEPLYVMIGSFFSAMTTPALLMLGMRNESHRVPRFLSFIGDKLSLYIYIFHVPVSRFLLLAAGKCGADVLGIYGWIHPFLTLIFTLALSSCWYGKWGTP